MRPRRLNAGDRNWAQAARSAWPLTVTRGGARAGRPGQAIENLVDHRMREHHRGELQFAHAVRAVRVDRQTPTQDQGRLRPAAGLVPAAPRRALPDSRGGRPLCWVSSVPRRGALPSTALTGAGVTAVTGDR